MAASHQPQKDGSSFRYPVVLTSGFRFYFLMASLFAVVAMLAWNLWLGVHALGGTFVSLPMNVAPHMWHAHEMVFGYTAAVMAGFFLTAVPNWTGTEEPGAGFVTFSGLVWLAGRVAIWFSGTLDPLVVALADLAFIPILAANVLSRLARKSQMRNLVFLLLLSALVTGNVLMHLEWIGWTAATAEAGVRLGVFVSAAMIAIVGGRVVPAFTRNALNRAGYEGRMPVSYGWLEKSGILLSLLTAAMCVAPLPEVVFGVLCLGAGAVNLARLSGWRAHATLASPILWILHLAFLMLAAGYLLYGFTLIFGVFSETSALHLLAAGAIGGMTLAIMSRAALGHSGLPLKVSRPVIAAYAAVVVAAIIRTFGTQIWEYFTVMLLSGTLWMIGFGLFFWVYFPILAKSKPG